MSDNVVVVDYGCKEMKAGFAYNNPTEDEPRIITPCAVELGGGQPASTSGQQQQQQQQRGGGVQHPVKMGRVVDWDAFEALLYYVLYDLLGWELGGEGNLLMAEPLLVGRPDRELLTQLMFEVFNVNGYFVQDQAVLALYAVGKTSGMVLDLGHQKADLCTVTEGAVNHNTIRRLEHAGGRSVTQHLTELLGRRGVVLPGGEAEAEALKELSALCAETEQDYARATSAAARAAGAASSSPPPGGETFTLPDGQQITLSPSERLSLGEALFVPSGTLGALGPSVVEAAYDGVACQGEVAHRKASYENVLVCGGGSLISGVAARFVHDLRARAPPGVSPALCPVPEYMPQPHTTRHASWVGGAVLAKVVQQNNHFMSKGEYDELGPSAIHRR